MNSRNDSKNTKHINSISKELVTKDHAKKYHFSLIYCIIRMRTGVERGSERKREREKHAPRSSTARAESGQGLEPRIQCGSPTQDMGAGAQALSHALLPPAGTPAESWHRRRSWDVNPGTPT